jgi:hypothetical protein
VTDRLTYTLARKYYNAMAQYLFFYLCAKSKLIEGVLNGIGKGVKMKCSHVSQPPKPSKHNVL